MTGPASSAAAADGARLPPGAVTRLPPGDPVRRAVRAWLAATPVDARAPIVVACSGGADSLALAAAVWAATRPAPRRSARVGDGGDGAAHPAERAVAAAVIDHGLQPGSADVARTAAAQLAAIGYGDVIVRRVLVGAAGGMEAAAREARYAALADIAGGVGAGAVLLAHTADDQAETVLLGLARGSGPRSIAGMRPWAPPWGRPLLAVRRTDTESACAAAGLEPWRDPQNADPAFTRARLRHRVLPLLDEVLGGGVVTALARTAALMSDDLAALDSIATAVCAEVVDDVGDLDCRALTAHPAAVRGRVLRRWVAGTVGITGLTHAHLIALDRLVTLGHSEQAVRLPGAVDVRRIGTRLHPPHPDAGRSPDGWHS